jgi:hypothetical protein
VLVRLTLGTDMGNPLLYYIQIRTGITQPATFYPILNRKTDYFPAAEMTSQFHPVKRFKMSESPPILIYTIKV